jgi:hypothetical protein
MTPTLLHFRPQEDITVFELARVVDFLCTELPYQLSGFFSGGNARLPLVIGSTEEWDSMQRLLCEYGIARHFHGEKPEELGE